MTAQDAGGALPVAEPYLLLAGVAGDFKATGPVHLTGRAERLAQPCPVLLNGQAAASVTGPAGDVRCRAARRAAAAPQHCEYRGIGGG